MAIKYGRAGSNHEKLAATLLLAATKAITGVMQHSDAANAERKPALVKALADASDFIFYAFYDLQLLYAQTVAL